MLDSLIVIIFSYLIGSLPSAWLVMKLFGKGDIRTQGTGNVGAMNAFESSGSKSIGILTLILDFAKGVAGVYIAFYVDYYSLHLPYIAAIMVVMAHNWNPFLKFAGGRGLAPTAGVFLLIGFVSIFNWIIIYLWAFRFLKRNVHFATIFATITVTIIAQLIPSYSIIFTALEKNSSLESYRIAVYVIGTMILIKHTEPIKELMENILFRDK